MSGHCGFTIATCFFRAFVYALLAATVVWTAAYRGPWWDDQVFRRKDPAFEFTSGSFHVSGGKARVLVFFAAPIILAAVCGACWEAVWHAHQLRGVRRAPQRADGYAVGASRGWSSLARSLLHLNLRPLGIFSPWVTVGEVAAYCTYVLVLLTMVWQGVQYKMAAYYDDTIVCADDPSARCYEGTGKFATSSSDTMLKYVAAYMGFAAAIQFSVILIPVSRDSKLWPALGIQYERAIAYHTALGHLAFFTLYLHGFLYMSYYISKHDWDYAVHAALHYDGGSVNVPAGVVAGLCAGPMWIASCQFVRRSYYRFFKTSHYLFIAVIASAMVHYGGFVYYLVPGLTLYVVHMIRRLSNWKGWNQWVVGSSARARTSIVNFHTEGDYTRLVLRNPDNLLAKGGTMVYISACSLLGTCEGHPMSVALRGAPPCLWHTASDSERVFTLYVKAVGAWTRALNKRDASFLAMDVDGFYTGVAPLCSMKQAGYSRVLLFAGGSGLTTFLALIQDWCEAHADGEPVPEVHFLWCCRKMAELQLLGEALASLLMSAGAGAETLFQTSLFCSGEEKDKSSLSISWPLAAPPESIRHVRGTTAYSVVDSLNSGLRTLIAGGSVVAGWLWSENIAKGAMLKGLATVLLMVVAPIIILVPYGTITRLVYRHWSKKKWYWCGSSWTRYLPLRRVSSPEPADEAATGNFNGPFKAFPVQAGRTPVGTVLAAEQALAKRDGVTRVKVLASGPGGMVDSVFTEARIVNWTLFDVEASSRDF